MNEKEISDYLKGTKFRLVKITRFKNHDRIAVEDEFCRLTWNMRKHIEDYPLSEFANMVHAHD